MGLSQTLITKYVGLKNNKLGPMSSVWRKCRTKNVFYNNNNNNKKKQKNSVFE